MEVDGPEAEREESTLEEPTHLSGNKTDDDTGPSGGANAQVVPGNEPATDTADRLETKAIDANPPKQPQDNVEDGPR